jgi:hypothetical protein
MRERKEKKKANICKITRMYSNLEKIVEISDSQSDN